MEVREHPGHGRAAFSTRSFSAGDLVWQEKPLLNWKGNTHNNSSALTAINNYLEALLAAPEDVRAKVKSHFRSPPSRKGSLLAELTEALEDIHPNIPKEELATLIGIVRSNAHSFENGKSSGLFTQASMVSHSCSPNMRVSSNAETLTYYAIKPIAVGDMLTFSYLDQRFLWHPTRTRVQFLLEPYGFVCRCSRCDGLDTTRCFSCPLCKIGRVHPDERPYILATEQGTSQQVDLTFECTGCKKTIPEADLPLDDEVNLYRDVIRLFQGSLDPEHYDWTKKVPEAREKLGEYHWIYADLCKRRGENGLPMIIAGVEAPTAAFLCFFKAIVFAKSIGEPSLMKYDFPLYVRVCKLRIEAIGDLMKRTSTPSLNWLEWLMSVQEFWAPQIKEAKEKDDAFGQLVKALGGTPLV